MNTSIKGKVISTKMDKTIVVKVSRMFLHPKYKKRMKRDKTYKVHCEKKVEVGDIVSIKPCRKMSKEKYFELV